MLRINLDSLDRKVQRKGGLLGRYHEPLIDAGPKNLEADRRGEAGCGSGSDKPAVIKAWLSLARWWDKAKLLQYVDSQEELDRYQSQL